MTDGYVVMSLMIVVAVCLAGATDAGAADPSPFVDEFDGTKLKEAVWSKGGSNNPAHNVLDGSLRLVSSGMMNQSFVATKRDDFNFFKQPLTVVWDLVRDKTLAGPYAATSFSKAYAGLQIGTTSVKKDVKGGAELGLTAWPGEVAKQGLDAPWFCTLNLGRLMPDDPTKNYGKEWVDHWKISSVPQRIIWTVGPTDWSVEIKGAKFVKGDPQKRSGKHKLKEADFAESGFHLLMFASHTVTSMESGAGNFISAVVYTDRIGVGTSPDAIPPYVEAPRKDIPTIETVLRDLLGKDFSEPARASKPQFLFGVNYAGSEFRPVERGFLVPTGKSLDYFKSKGIRLIRLPVTWARLQPTLSEPINEKYLDGVRQTIREMGKRDMKVLLDMHDYARHGRNLIGSPEVPVSAFAALWKKLAETFKDEPAIWGYGLTNEPYSTEGKWPAAAQAGIDAVRSVDKKTMIVIGGDGFSGTQFWMKNGAPLAKQLKDPSNNLCWEGHCYFDAGEGGKFRRSYEHHINRQNPSPIFAVDPMCGVRAIEPFVKWLKENNYKGILGEFGVPANLDRDPRWLIILDNVYEYLHKNEIPSTYWSAGERWTPGRCYVIDPDRGGPNKGKDRPQMHILLKHARLYAGAATGK